MVGYFVAWLALVAASMPVSFSLIFMGMAWLLIEGGTMVSAPQRLIGGIDSFPLLAVPCFILAGVAMNSGGVTDRIYGFAKALVGQARSRTLNEQLDAEREQFVANLQHDNAAEGLRAFFEKRAPRFN